MKTKYSLKVIAPDGEYKNEGDFETVDAAWRRADDMGSRWFFYPVCVVTGNSRQPRIVDLPHGMPSDWKGRTLKKLCAAFAADSEHVCDYVNGKIPFCILP